MSRRELGREAQPPPNAEERLHLSAVGWLGGPELLSRLGMILRKAQSPRGWMSIAHGFAHDEHDRRDGRLVRVVTKEGVPIASSRPHAEVGAGTVADVEVHAIEASEAAARLHAAAPPSVDSGVASNEARAPGEEPAAPEQVWFDYIADMGDDTDSMYAVAYGCQIDLGVREGGELVVGAELERDDRATSLPNGLPRGQFLFVGGDSAYHVADVVTLTNRVAKPFRWAFDDIEREAPRKPSSPLPRLYGIPGNHDWYDHLAGFARLFRRSQAKAIVLPGFQTVQIASYAAIQLPFDWQIWGLDIYTGLGRNQATYFESLRPRRPGEESSEPTRLILCTPSPPVAFDEIHLADFHRESLERLRLTQAYDPEIPLPARCTRLDLSGDVHHYARYQHGNPHYAAVVSGLGGAFHHPTFTTLGTRRADVKYPPPELALKHVAQNLLWPTSTLVGSWFRLLPLLIGALLGFASARAPGSEWFLRRAFGWAPWVDLGIKEGDCRSWEVSLGLVLDLAVAAAFFAAAAWLFVRTSEVLRDDPERKRGISKTRPGFGPGETFDPYRGYWLTGLSALLGALALTVYPSLSIAATSIDALLDVGTFLVFVLPLAAAGLGYVLGAKGLTVGGRLRVGGIGLLHGVMQVVTPFVFARCALATVTSAIVASTSVGVTFALLVASRALFVKSRAPLLLLSWVAAWAGAIGALAWCSTGHVPNDDGPLVEALRIVGGALVAVPLATSYVAWYFAVCGLFDAHNNEVGGAARVTAFRQLIRFRLDAKGLRGHVIAIERTDPEKDEKGVASYANPPRDLRLRLIDVFDLEAR